MFDLKACFYDSDSRRTNYSLKDRRSFLDNRKHRFAWYHFTGEGDGAHEMIRSGVRLCPQEIIMKHVRLASLVPEFAFAALLLSQASTVAASPPSAWREAEALKLTRERRPDLLAQGEAKAPKSH